MGNRKVLCLCDACGIALLTPSFTTTNLGAQQQLTAFLTLATMNHPIGHRKVLGRCADGEASLMMR